MVPLANHGHLRNTFSRGQTGVGYPRRESNPGSQDGNAARNLFDPP